MATTLQDVQDKIAKLAEHKATQAAAQVAKNDADAAADSARASQQTAETNLRDAEALVTASRDETIKAVNDFADNDPET